MLNANGSAEGAAASSGAASKDAAADAPKRAARHVALIMDGNGRWARARGLPRLAGHYRGVETVRALLKACPDLGVEYLTLYAFSTENWARPPAEVAGLMRLFRIYMRRDAEQLRADGVRVVFVGDPSPLDPDIQDSMRALEERTRENTRLTLAVALNYGARAEITAAARRLAHRVAAGALAADDIDETALQTELATREMPDPDLIIRTSGEQRLSNFLLWQAAYAELMFVPETWPDFTAERFKDALARFAVRDRRYGGLGP